jgi:phosphoribosyl-AMP cyclohydrolase
MTAGLYCDSNNVKITGKRSAGNLHAAFDEGDQGEPWSLLYWTKLFMFLGEEDMSWLDEVKWNSDGLAPAIAQDVHSGKVLMLAWMNRESLELTLKEGKAVYWSRSRQQLWRKGETSGHFQLLHELRLDCDRDAVLLQVEQKGGIACHTGRESCFFYEQQGDGWQAVEPVIKSSAEIYHDTPKDSGRE